jgi:hypothetical protein
MSLEYLNIAHVPLKDIKRIFSKISTHPDVTYNNIPCWIWTGSREKWGYGQIWWSQTGCYEKIYRVLFAWTIHPLPKGQKHGELDHLCRNPSCCNPVHLEFVSSRINTLRGNNIAAQNARKTKCVRGHPFRLRENGRRYCPTCNHIRSRQA